MNKIGVDIVNISRMTKLSEATKKGIFNKAEIERSNTFTSSQAKAEYLAGRFAAKEALAKALGVAFTKLKPSEIVVTNLDSGKPVLNLEGQSKENFPTLKCEISISHDSPSAIAVVLVEEMNG
ncbi:MAG: holo-ACP synthase [Sphaerochaetaceae bacterium]|jgi:holo-[acyl-carrier protein] synthase|nr:holo-ACP synthase [Sphaerochaetaceae bacterium]